MELLERIEKLKRLKLSEKEILSDIYSMLLYIAMILIILISIFININNPTTRIVISAIMAFIYTLAVIYLIGLAVAFGTIRAKRVILKTEIDIKEKDGQGEEE